MRKHFPHSFNLDTPKTYVTPREYLHRVFPSNMGSPLYYNQAYNFMLMGPRTFGKSFTVGNIIAHEYLFDGALAYPYTSNLSTNILVGASLSKYSNDLLDKCKLTLDLLPGSTLINNISYPCPFYKQSRGSLKIGSALEAVYKKKVGGRWEELGSKSVIKHVSYDNPFAGIGTRNSISVMEEIGEFVGLLDSVSNNRDTLRNDTNKFGTEIYIGTGGNMESGTIDASKMFYEPEKYEILPYNDIWEHRGKIGYFLPATHGLNDYKDENGITNVEAALKALRKERESKQNSKGGSDALNKIIQFKPLVPSEIFLSRSSNIFPTAEIKRRLTLVEQDNIFEKVAKKVELFFDPTSPFNGVNYAIDIKDRLDPILDFPLPESSSKEGCVIIYELPHLFDDKTPSDAYIIGHDPYKSDSITGDSLASIYVIKTKKYFNKNGHDEIVASFVGRPYNGRNVVNEILLKLSLFYGNAKIYFENAVGNTKEYFEKTGKLSLLATQPTTVLSKKASYDTTPQIIYGYPMSNQVIKREAISYLRDWLLEEHHILNDSTYRNLDLISDPGLLKELLAFNFDINTDRVMGMAGCIVGLNETQNQFKNTFFKEEADVSLSFITKNKNLFYERIPQTETQLYGEDTGQLQMGERND